MGIKYLHSYIYKNIIAEHNIPLVKLEQLNGLTLAIDIAPFIYNMISTSKDPNNCFAKYITFLETFKSAGIKLIVVFDKDGYSATSEFKQFTISQRKLNKPYHMYTNNKLKSSENETIDTHIDHPSITPNSLTNISILNNCTRSKFKYLTKLFGFTWSESNNEAEAKCVKLFNTLKVNGCISTDSDLLLHGCTNIFKDFNQSTKEIRHINMATILKHFNMSQSLFTTLCILYGTDYFIPDDSIHSSTLCEDYPTSLITNLNECIEKNINIKTSLLSILFDSYKQFYNNNIKIINTLNDELIIYAFIVWLKQTLNFDIDINKVNQIRQLLFKMVNDNDDSVVSEDLFVTFDEHDIDLTNYLLSEFGLIIIDVNITPSPKKSKWFNTKNNYKQIITT
jgi:5'-3' exonuclease